MGRTCKSSKRRRQFTTKLEPLEPRLLLAADLRINEFQAVNDTTFTDEDGDPSDWLEIYNAGQTTVSLEDWYLTDNPANPRKWAFPSVDLPADDYLVVFASNKDRNGVPGELHTNYRLAGSGEYLALVADEPDPQNPGQSIATIVHEYAPRYPQQIANLTYGVHEVIDGVDTVLVPEFAPATAIVPVDDSLDDPSDDDNRPWTQVAFDDVLWTSGTTGVGYDLGKDYGDLLGLDVVNEMSGQQTSVYTRIEFDVADPTAFNRLVLRMKYDDGFVAYLNGLFVASANAPEVPQFDDTATQENHDSNALVFEDFNITQHLDALLAGQTNVLAIHGLNFRANNSDMLILPELVATDVQNVSLESSYFIEPTPGGANSFGDSDLGPIVSETSHSPHVPTAVEDLVVTARITETFRPVSSVTLRYRVMFGSETPLAMVDDGSGADAVAGDGTYTAVIPSSQYTAGQMVRWYVVAGDTSNRTMRWPLFQNPVDSEQYLGTMVEDPSVDSNLPVMYWFVPSASIASNASTGRGAVFYGGEFYDNVLTDIHGQSTQGFPKKSFDFDFNRDHRFLWAEGEQRVKDVNLLTNWADRSKVRNTLAYETFANMDAAHHFAFPVRVQANVSRSGGSFSLANTTQFFSIADMIEDGDNRYTERIGLDPDGALYKMYNTFTSTSHATSGVEKKTRKNEGNTDLFNLANSVLNQSGQARTNYIFDNVDLAVTINTLVGLIVTSSHDCCHKNYYLYRDPPEPGSALEWHLLPWDVDLSYGHRWISGPAYFDDLIISNIGLFTGNNNGFISPLFNTPAIRQMYLRRLRTVMDELLQPPGTPAEELKYEARIAELVAQIDPTDDDPPYGNPRNPHTGSDDADLDYRTWEQVLGSPWRNVAASESRRTMRDEVDRLLNNFLPNRRNFLYNQQTVGNGGEIPAALPDLASLPEAQRGIALGVIAKENFSPASGNQDEEYLEIVNSNSFAVDVSGWELTGGVEMTFQGGTVIPANSTMYVSPNVAAFRARGSGPTGGQGRFVVGGYQGHLSSFGETVGLRDKAGSSITSASYVGEPTAAQQHLRITEIQYHPAPPTPDELLVDPTWIKDDFEFVELQNTGGQPLDLDGVSFAAGIDFTFTGLTLQPGEHVVVVADQDAFVARYGTNVNVAGEFVNSTLDSGGETINLEDGDGGTILQFAYRDGWYPHTDGDGFSLVVNDPLQQRELWDDKAGWRASTHAGGNPGAADAGLAVGSIEINEILAHSDTPDGDWVELLNTSAAPISVGGWYLSDDADNLAKYRIADTQVIPPGEFLVLTQTANFGIGAADPGSLDGFGLSELGETVYLTQATLAGELLGYREIQSFAASENGVTLGRHVKPDGGDDFVALAAATFADVNSPPQVGPIVIHEVLYDPPSGGDEYIELRNTSGSPVPLFDLNNPASTWSFGDGIQFVFPTGVVVPAGGLVLVVPIDPAAFRAAYNVPASTQIFGPWSGALDNQGEKLELFRPGAPDPGPPPIVPQLLVDRLTYNNNAPWPDVAGGRSLQRQDVTLYGNDVTNWSAGPVGGTPGNFPPQVSAVFVGGSGWTVAPVRIAGEEPGSSADPLVAPWINVDRFTFTFSRDVSVAAGDLIVTGVNRAQYTVADFDYEAASFTATWTLDAVVRADRLTLRLTDAVVDAGGAPLAGNLPLEVNVLPGDVDGSGQVSRADVVSMLTRLNTAVGTPRYDVRYDVNVDGLINLADLRGVLVRFPSTLPPASSVMQPAAAVDAALTTRPDELRARRIARGHRLRPAAVDEAIGDQFAAPTIRRPAVRRGR